MGTSEFIEVYSILMASVGQEFLQSNVRELGRFALFSPCELLLLPTDDASDEKGKKRRIFLSPLPRKRKHRITYDLM